MAGITILPVTLGVLYLFWKAERRPLAAWIGACLFIAGTGIFHARALILLFIAIATFLVAQLVNKIRVHNIARWLAFAMGILAGVFFSLQIYLTQFYCDGQCAALVAVALLAPLAILQMPGLSLGIFIFILGILGVSVLSLPETLLHYSQKWLDGPFLEIAFFLPLSLIGGMGAAALLNYIERWRRVSGAMTCLLLILIGWNFIRVGAIEADECCKYVTPADLEVIRWLDDNLSQDATILVSGFTTGNTHIGVDAGLWITPLTGRKTVFVTHSTNWEELEVVREICKKGDVYIFAGHLPNSFQRARMTRSEWYEIVHAQNGTRLIHANVCIGNK
jgi:hypothetical protein